MRLRAVASGSLALIALQTILTSKQTGRIGDLFALPASWARRLIDPTVPAIANRAASTTTPTAAAATSLPGAVDWSSTLV